MKARLKYHRRVVAESAWVFVGQGASAIATLVGLRLITEMVPAAIYGMVVLALGVVMLAHGLVVGPLMQAVLRLHPELARVGQTWDLRRATLAALRKPSVITLSALALLGLAWALHEPRDAWLAALAIVLFIAEAARTFEITFLNAARRQRDMALLMTADAWLRPLAAVALVWAFGASSAAVLGGYLVGCVLALTGFKLASHKDKRGELDAAVASTPAADITRQLWTYALPLTALPLIGWVSGQADRYLIGGMTGAAAAGLYAALYGLASKPFLIFTASIELALRQPYYARANGDDRIAEWQALAWWLAVVVAGSTVLCLLFVLFHTEIAALVLAADYRAHSALMGLIAAGHVLLATAQVFVRVCYAHHDTRGVLWVEMAGATITVAVAAPLIYIHGIAGAAWAVPLYFGAQLLIAATRARWSWRSAHEPLRAYIAANGSPNPRGKSTR